MRSYRFAAAGMFLALLLVFSSLFAQIQTPQQLKTYLDKKEVVFEDISVRFGTATWNMYSQEGEADLATPRKEFGELFLGKELNSVIDAWYKKAGTITDAILKRRVIIWKNILTGAKINYDPEIMPMQNSLEQWLGDATVKDKPPVEEISEKMRTLIKLKNKKARELGYDGFLSLYFDITGIGEDFFNELIEKMDSYTKKPFNALVEEVKKSKKDGSFTGMDLRGLIVSYYRAAASAGIAKDRMFPLMKKTINDIGFDYDNLPVRIVEKQIPFGGNGLAIRIPDDFRIVNNVGQPLGVWLHELGHGIQGMFTTIESPVLKGYEWCLGNLAGLYGESIAETMAKFMMNREWLRVNANMDDQKIDELYATLKKYAPGYFRYLMPQILFEVELYKNPDRPAKEISNEIFHKYLGIDSPQGFHENLANVMYVAYPVYLQNYVLSEIISWQVHRHLEKAFGKDYAFNKKTGPYFTKHFIEYGELYPWQEKLKRATGSTIDIDGYFKHLGM